MIGRRAVAGMLAGLTAGATGACSSNRPQEIESPPAVEQVAQPSPVVEADTLRPPSARELYEANEVAAGAARSLGSVFGSAFDVHLSATMAAPPVTVGALGIGTAEKAALSVLQRIPAPSTVLRQALNQLAHDSLKKTPNTQVFNLTGQPAMNLPLFWNGQNLPIGVQIAGAFGADELLLRLAAQVEQARPWRHLLPQVG